MASRIGFLVLSLGMTVLVIRLLLREEAELLRVQGEPYRRYCARVPRLLASLRPRVPPVGSAPHWTPAFRAELMYWLMALAMLVFAITPSIQIFWGIFAVAMVSSWLYKRPETKRASATTR